MSSKQSIYDFSPKLANGEDFAMESLKGEVLLVINTASKCGFTASNHADLKELMEKHYEKGLRVLLFPCNQFGSQESGPIEEIEKQLKEIDERLLIFDKVEVNGKNEIPLYAYLKNEKKGIFGTSKVKWNFTKFLVDREGKVVGRYSPNTKPLKIVGDIEKLY